MFSLHGRGFLLPSYYIDDTQINAVKIKYGKVFMIDSVYVGGMGRGGRYRKPFSEDNVRVFVEGILYEWANKGYPFVGLWLDSLRIKDDRVDIFMRLDKGGYYVFDSVRVRGDDVYPRWLIERRCGIVPGSSYSEERVRNIKRRIEEMGVIMLADEPFVEFSPGRCFITLFVKKRNVVIVDGMLGGGNVNDKFQISGSISVVSRSLFRRGEEINFNYERSGGKVSQMRVSALFPFNVLPFYIVYGGGEWKILQEDTVYVMSVVRGEASLSREGRQSVSVFVKVQNTAGSRLSDTGYVVRYVAPGMKVYYNALDFVYNPRRGVIFQGEVNSGTRTSMSVLGEERKKAMHEIVFNGGFYVPVGRLVVGNMSVRGGAIILSDTIKVGEMFRVGGMNSLRGYLENSFYAQKYVVSTIEARYIIDMYSHISFFVDWGWIKGRSEVWVASPGSGISMFSKNSIVRVMVASGFNLGRRITSQSIVLHVGYSRLF